MSESLPVLLSELKLPTFKQHFEQLEQKAIEHSWSFSQFLCQLCEQKISCSLAPPESVNPILQPL